MSCAHHSISYFHWPIRHRQVWVTMTLKSRQTSLHRWSWRVMQAVTLAWLWLIMWCLRPTFNWTSKEAKFQVAHLLRWPVASYKHWRAMTYAAWRMWHQSLKLMVRITATWGTQAKVTILLSSMTSAISHCWARSHKRAAQEEFLRMLWVWNRMNSIRWAQSMRDISKTRAILFHWARTRIHTSIGQAKFIRVRTQRLVKMLHRTQISESKSAPLNKAHLSTQAWSHPSAPTQRNPVRSNFEERPLVAPQSTTWLKT